MGAYRFERIPAVKGSENNNFVFDSSADRAITKKYGLKEGSVVLTLTGETPTHKTYDVQARANAEGAPLQRVGELITMTRDEVWRRQAAGERGPAFPPTRESVQRRQNEFHLKPERA